MPRVALQQVRASLLASGVASVVMLTLAGSVPGPGPVAAASREHVQDPPGLDDPGLRAVGRSVRLRAVSVAGPVLFPGTGHALDVRVSNPNPRPVVVTAMDVGVRDVRSPRAGGGLPCGTEDFTTRPSQPVSVVVAARSSTSLSSAGVPRPEWPWVGMVDSTTNQDGCQDAELLLDVQVEGAFA